MHRALRMPATQIKRENLPSSSLVFSPRPFVAINFLLLPKMLKLSSPFCTSARLVGGDFNFIDTKRKRRFITSINLISSGKKVRETWRVFGPFLRARRAHMMWAYFGLSIDGEIIKCARAYLISMTKRREEKKEALHRVATTKVNRNYCNILLTSPLARSLV